MTQIMYVCLGITSQIMYVFGENITDYVCVCLVRRSLNINTNKHAAVIKKATAIDFYYS